LIVQKTVLEQQLAKAEKGEASSIEPLRNLILGGKSGQKMGFREQLVRYEIISAKSRLEPPYSLTDANRFLQKTLDSIG